MPYFHYIEKDFNRKKKAPVSIEEYEVLKNQYEDFLKNTLDKIGEEDKSTLSGMYSPKVGFIMVSISIVIFLLIEFMFKKNNSDWVDWLFLFGLLIGIPGTVILFQGIRSWASLFDYKANLKKYYKYHRKLVNKTEAYDEYLRQFKN